jgi:hypothetical protein
MEQYNNETNDSGVLISDILNSPVDPIIDPRDNYIVVFDLDNTLTCGIENAKKAIQFARANNFIIAFSTARAVQYFADLNLIDLGLNPNDFSKDFYTCVRMDHLFGNNMMALQENIAQQKLNHLIDLSNKYHIPRSHIILIDDNILNIMTVQKNGFQVIHANADSCGMTDDVDMKLYAIMRNNG